MVCDCRNNWAERVISDQDVAVLQTSAGRSRVTCGGYIALACMESHGAWLGGCGGQRLDALALAFERRGLVLASNTVGPRRGTLIRRMARLDGWIYI